MKYAKAVHVLPAALLTEIQKYVQGELLYIPKAYGTHKEWGSNTQSKKRTESRNTSIRLAFRAGKTIEQLAEQYHLSFDSIKKIVYSK